MREFAKSLGLASLEESLLKLALTHSSYVNDNPREKDNERLEFLGDSVLSILTSELLYAKFPHCREGQLSRIRANMVCEEMLSQIAQHIGIPKVVRLGKSAANSGGRNNASILAGCVEALLGATYLAGGLEAARELYNELYKEIIPTVTEEWSVADPKSALQELAPEQVRYNLVEESGPDHNRRYTTEVYVSNKLIARGEGRSKKQAEQAAARNALKNLR